MRNLRRAAVLGSSVLLAAGSGYIMQNSDSLGQRPDLAQSRVSGVRIAPVRMDEIQNIQPVASIAVSRSSLIGGSMELPIIPVRDVRESNVASQVPPSENAEPGGFELAGTSTCAASALVLMEANYGLAGVEVMAPCHPQEVVRLSDGVLEFDILTDTDGQWAGMIPVNAQQVDMLAKFANGEASEATLHLDAPSTFSSVAVNWSGADALRLNAFEYGSAVGEVGHVSGTSPRTPDTQLGGYILVLGEVEDGAMAEVYMAPNSMADIQFDLEALVTDASCGADLSGRLIRTKAPTAPEVTEFSLAMPDCAAVGTSLLMELPEMPVELASAQ